MVLLTQQNILRNGLFKILFYDRLTFIRLFVDMFILYTELEFDLFF